MKESYRFSTDVSSIRHFEAYILVKNAIDVVIVIVYKYYIWV